MTSEIKPANKDETETEEPTLFDKSEAQIDDASNQVLHNAKSVAEYFGKSLRTIQDWMAGGMSQFCTPATPGKNDGHFPVAEIIKWRKKIEGNFRKEQDDEIFDLRKKNEELRLREREFDYRKKTGGLIDFDEMITMAAQAAAGQKARLFELVDKLRAIIPSSTPDELIESFVEQANDTVQQVCESIGNELLKLAKKDNDEAKN